MGAITVAGEMPRADDAFLRTPRWRVPRDPERVRGCSRSHKSGGDPPTIVGAQGGATDLPGMPAAPMCAPTREWACM
jgi:hypothetical protein